MQKRITKTLQKKALQKKGKSTPDPRYFNITLCFEALWSLSISIQTNSGIQGVGHLAVKLLQASVTLICMHVDP